MKPRDLFGVLVPCVGLLVLIGSLLYAYSAVVVLAAPDTPDASSPLTYIGACLLLLVLSTCLLRGAPHLVRFAYRYDQSENTAPDAAPNSGVGTQPGHSGATKGPPTVA